MSTLAAHSPSEIARETIKQLALRRVPPTPDNYAQLYAEVSGGRDAWSGHAAPRMLLRLAAELPRAGSAAGRLGAQLERAVQEHDWDKARMHLLALAQLADGGTWGELLAELLKQWEARHRGLTTAQKRRSIDHVLAAFGGDAAKLYPRLDALVKSWSATPTTGVETPDTAGVARPDRPKARELARQPVALEADRDIPPLLRDLVAQTIEFAVVERLGYDDALAAEAGALAERVRTVATRREIADAAAALRAFFVKLELSGESQQTLIDSLLRLLLLMVNNVSELVEDDGWLAGQVGRIRELLAGPLDVRAIAEAERGFRNIVFKQGVLKHSLDEAKAALKTMLTNFVDRLSTMANATGDYHDDLERYAGEIAAAQDVHALGAVLDAVMQKTRSLQSDITRARDDLSAAREQAQLHEARVRDLERQLAAVSQLVREDPLTGALNRRGLEEAFAVEAARSDREGRPLGLAVLDIDNFKALNDSLGHAAGDEALKHLAAAVRDTLRPLDVVARYGGEEFVILLPGAATDEAAAVMVRVQRALTRRIFMHNNERVLVTFSAGVAVRRAGEDGETLIARADAALYEAKRLGKNRVVAADSRTQADSASTRPN